MAGAGVLALYDKLQEILFGKVYRGGKYFTLPQPSLDRLDMSLIRDTLRRVSLRVSHSPVKRKRWFRSGLNTSNHYSCF